MKSSWSVVRKEIVIFLKLNVEKSGCVLMLIILIFNRLIDKVHKSMPPKRRLSKPLVLTILVLNGFFCGYAATPLCGVIFL